MMKKEFIHPIMSVVTLDDADVLTTSIDLGYDETEGDLPGFFPAKKA